MKIHDAEFIVFDVETTGLSPQEGDRIIEIAALKVRHGKVIGEFHSMVNPKRFIPEAATRVNNITEEMVLNAPVAGEVLPRMTDFISGGCLTGHNVRFDIGFLGYELALMGRKLNDATPVVDTLKMAKELLPYLSSYKLGYIARSLGISVGDTHRAMVDVHLTVAVLLRLMDMASEQKIDDIGKFFSAFGVEKPAFKLNQATQASLF